MATNDVWRITCTAAFGSGIAMTQAHFRLKASTPEPNNAALAAVAADVINIYRPVQTNFVSWRSWKAVQVRANTVSYSTRPCLATGGRGEEGIFTTNNGGTAAPAELLPHQCALVSTLKTSFVGRSRRGRVYTFGLGETSQDTGVWSTTPLTAITASWATFLAEYGSSPAGTDPLFEFGIWSMRIATGCRPRPAPPYGASRRPRSRQRLRSRHLGDAKEHGVHPEPARRWRRRLSPAAARPAINGCAAPFHSTAPLYKVPLPPQRSAPPARRRARAPSPSTRAPSPLPQTPSPSPSYM